MSITIESTQVISAITVQGNTGQSIVGTPTQLLPNQPLSWVYRVTNTTWYPLAGAGAVAPLVSGTAQNSTSGTSIDFTGIPSWVKRITVMFNGISTSSSSAEIYVQIGSGSVETTGYLGTSGSSDGLNLGGANYTTAFGVRVRNAAQLSSGTLVLTSLGSNLWVANGMVGGNSNVNTTWTNGSKTTSGTLDRLRITTSTGTDTFDAGSVNILYE
jgi:hypothetical protein